MAEEVKRLDLYHSKPLLFSFSYVDQNEITHHLWNAVNGQALAVLPFASDESSARHGLAEAMTSQLVPTLVGCMERCIQTVAELTLATNL